jgi:hypothetical protein
VISFAQTSDVNNQVQSLFTRLIVILDQELHQILEEHQTSSGNVGADSIRRGQSVGVGWNSDNAIDGAISSLGTVDAWGFGVTLCGSAGT